MLVDTEVSGFVVKYSLLFSTAFCKHGDSLVVYLGCQRSIIEDVLLASNSCDVEKWGIILLAPGVDTFFLLSK